MGSPCGCLIPSHTRTGRDIDQCPNCLSKDIDVDKGYKAVNLILDRSLHNNLSIRVIKFYRRHVSHRLNSHCRFYPSCSLYAMLAIQKYGQIRGWHYAIKRLLRCNPRNFSSCIDFP
ncbi:MAG: membrane protein insertion efficiency factor YidD [Candidatus Omnitrophica bacterium]|nr:membrane protein insertion efficiency factor YidD [Candidatus Omnitrophota bacterium]